MKLKNAAVSLRKNDRTQSSRLSVFRGLAAKAPDRRLPPNEAREVLRELLAVGESQVVQGLDWYIGGWAAGADCFCWLYWSC